MLTSRQFHRSGAIEGLKQQIELFGLGILGKREAIIQRPKEVVMFSLKLPRLIVLVVVDFYS